MGRMDPYGAESAADRVRTEFDILDRMLEHLDLTDESSVSLTLAQAKRCRRACQTLVRALAATRQQLQPNGGTSE